MRSESGKGPFFSDGTKRSEQMREVKGSSRKSSSVISDSAALGGDRIK